MSRSTPMDLLFAQADMRCTTCNAKAGTCGCWERCTCGWHNVRGTFCRNPETIRCSGKLLYGAWCRSCRVYHPKATGCPAAASPIRRFEYREATEAMDHAEGGGIALHVWEAAPGAFTDAPGCFKRSRTWAHLIDADVERLKATARRLGVRVIKVGREGRRGQHIDLCGKPLDRAIALAAASQAAPQKNATGMLFPLDSPD